jgi:hypothetical protein
MADTAPVMIWIADDNRETPILIINGDFTGRSWMKNSVMAGQGVHPEDYEHCLQTVLTQL